MATETHPKDLKSKTAPVLQVIPLQQVYPLQKVYPMQPVILVPLNPPENDHLFLSITSFFFILLAIPALLFSFKTREANILWDQRKAQRNSRLALGFSISSSLVGSTLIISSIVVRVMKQRE